MNDSQELLAVKGELSNLNTTNTAPNHYASAESILALDNPLNNSVQNVIFASPELISKYNTTTDKRFGIYFEKAKTGTRRSKEEAMISGYLSELLNYILSNLKHC